MPIPTRQDILEFYDSVPNTDKSAYGFYPNTLGRETFCKWFAEQATEGFYVTRAGVRKEGHTPVRIRGLYLLEKALNARRREQVKNRKTFVSGSGHVTGALTT